MHGLRLMRFAGSPKTSKLFQESKAIKHASENTLRNEVVSDTVSPSVKPEPKLSESKAQKKTESLNQLFRLPPYGGTSSSLKILRRPQKLRKEEKVSVSKIYSDKIKDVLKRVSKQKDKLNKKSIKHKSRYFIASTSNDNVEVLFTSKNWRRKRKAKTLQRYSGSSGGQPHRIVFKSKSNFDVQRSTKNRHVCCRLQLPWRSRHNTHKNKKKLIATLPCHQKTCGNFHSDPMIKSSTKSGRCVNCIRTPSLHYNLVDFSYNAKEKGKRNGDSFHKIKANTCTSCNRKRTNPRFYANKEVCVTPSCLPVFLKGGGDTFLNKSIQVCPNKTDNLRRVRCYRPTHVRKCSKRENNNDNATRISLFLANTALKYVLFGISIVVWSPCILITFLIWVITYPMRPQEIIDTVNNAAHLKKHRKCHRHKNEFLAAIYEGSKSFIKKVTFFYENVLSLLKTDKQKLETCNKQRSEGGGRKSPNPDKKYTLFYNHKRGWVIKPIKSANTTEFVEHSDDNCCKRDILFKDKDRQKNLQPEQACQVNFTFGQMEETAYRKKFKFSLQCLKVSQAFHKKGQTYQLKTKHKKSVKTQSYFGHNKALDPSIKEDGRDSKIVLSDTCEVQTNFINSSKPNIPVYATLQNRKYVTFESAYPECDPCNINIPQLSTKSNFYPSDSSLNRGQNKCSCIKILRKIKPQQYPPKYIKVKKYDNATMRQQNIPPKHVETIKQYSPKHRQMVKQTIPKRNEMIRHNVPKRNLKESVTKRSTKTNVVKKRNNWYKNRSFFKSFRKKISNIVNNAEKNMWNYDKCDTLYVQTLRRKPCYWIYKRAPSFYPYFMIYYKFYESMVHGALIVMTACIWCPVFLWCYCCALLLCRCL